MLLYVTSVRYSGVSNLSYKLLYVGRNHKDLSYSEKLKEHHKNTSHPMVLLCALRDPLPKTYACPF